MGIYGPMAIQIAAGQEPLGSNSCLPLIEGAPCSLDVTMEKATLSFMTDDAQKLYQLDKPNVQLMR